jgi:hypothetical protein
MMMLFWLEPHANSRQHAHNFSFGIAGCWRSMIGDREKKKVLQNSGS